MGSSLPTAREGEVKADLPVVDLAKDPWPDPLQISAHRRRWSLVGVGQLINQRGVFQRWTHRIGTECSD